MQFSGSIFLLIELQYFYCKKNYFLVERSSLQIPFGLGVTKKIWVCGSLCDFGVSSRLCQFTEL